MGTLACARLQGQKYNVRTGDLGFTLVLYIAGFVCQVGWGQGASGGSKAPVGSRWAA